MQHIKNGIKRSHPLRLLGFAVGMLLFVFLAFDAATRAEDPKLVEGQPGGSMLTAQNILLVDNDFYLEQAQQIKNKQSKPVAATTSPAVNGASVSKTRPATPAAQLPEAASDSAAQALDTAATKAAQRRAKP